MQSDGIAVATAFGYSVTNSEVCACIAELKRYVDGCQAAVTKAVVFVLNEGDVKFAEGIIEDAGLKRLVEVCPAQIPTLNIEYLANEYGRAHNLEVVCIP